MARIAFILLCHKDPKGVIAQARRLTGSGDYVSIHFDARASAADFDLIRTALADNPGVTFAARRLKCGWGEWSLVAATLEAVRAAMYDPSQPTVDWLWRVLIIGLVGALGVALIGVAWAVLDGNEGTSPDVMVTVFTALLTGLIGLFAKSPAS